MFWGLHVSFCWLYLCCLLGLEVVVSYGLYSVFVLFTCVCIWFELRVLGIFVVFDAYLSLFSSRGDSFVVFIC